MGHVHQIDAETVIYRLEEAGRTLLALPSANCLPAGLKACWPAFPQAAMEAYGYGTVEIRPPVPDARQITRMDEAYQWVALLPTDWVNRRRTLLMRSLVSPRTDRHLWSYRTIGLALGVSHEITRRWHRTSIDELVRLLDGRAGRATAPPFKAAAPPLRTIPLKSQHSG